VDPDPDPPGLHVFVPPGSGSEFTGKIRGMDPDPDPDPSPDPDPNPSIITQNSKKALIPIILTIVYILSFKVM
jgi:hypothetical protein